MLLDFEELHASEQVSPADLTELIPQSFHAEFNVLKVPLTALLDYALKFTKKLLASDVLNLTDKEKDTVLGKPILLSLGDVVDIISNANMQVSINNLVIKAPSYEAHLKGNAKATSGTKLGFLGRMEFDISNGGQTVSRLIKISQKNNYKTLLSTLKILNKLRKTAALGPAVYEYELIVGYDGHKRLNGADLGPLFPDIDLNLPSFTPHQEVPPLTFQKGSGTNVGIETRLLKLKKLYEKGLINKEEFDGKRKRILDEL